MIDLTKINYIKVIDKNKWLKDRENFKIEKSDFFKDELIQNGLKRTWYKTTRWNLSNYLYQKYYLDLYDKGIWIDIFIILINWKFDDKTKELKTKEIYEYLSVYEYFKRTFNLIFDLLDNFEILQDEIYNVDRAILENLNNWDEIQRENIVKLSVSFISYINTITKICENLDILLGLLELIKWIEYIQINKRDAFLYFNKLFWWKKEKNNYFENIYMMRNYFLHKHSPDFHFHKIIHNNWLLIYENHFQFILGNFTIKSYQMIKWLIDFYFEKYNNLCTLDHKENR